MSIPGSLDSVCGVLGKQMAGKVSGLITFFKDLDAQVKLLSLGLLSTLNQL